LKKLCVCVLFGGVSPEHEVSLRSAESVLNHLDRSKYNIFPVGITKEGDWILFGGYGLLDAALRHMAELPGQPPRGALARARTGLLSFENDCVVRERIDVVFPVLHGENGEDGSVQGLAADRGHSLCRPARRGLGGLHGQDDHKADRRRTRACARRRGSSWREAPSSTAKTRCWTRRRRSFAYPMFVKPAGTGSSVGISKAKDREGLRAAIETGRRLR
jgi:D-alanine-D-alanine ligase